MEDNILKGNVPKHIAIIMDGNSRWAKKNSVTQKSGYSQGIKAAQSIIRYSKKIGVKYLTLFAFSSENWHRPKKEVSEIMDMFRDYLKKDVKKLTEENIRIYFIGDRGRLDDDIQTLMHDAEEKSKHNEFNLILAISYGSRGEILNTALKFASAIKDKITPQEELRGIFEAILNPHNMPDPDLLIRTSGEHRLSNFLLWQVAYTEFFFTDKLWPDFTEQNLDEAISDYNSRERRYGR